MWFSPNLVKFAIQSVGSASHLSLIFDLIPHPYLEHCVDSFRQNMTKLVRRTHSTTWQLTRKLINNSIRQDKGNRYRQGSLEM